MLQIHSFLSKETYQEVHLKRTKKKMKKCTCFFFPNEYSVQFQLTQENNTVLLGIILLQTASEELAVPREDLSMARKEELQKLLLQQVPTVLSLLNSEFCNTVELNYQHHVKTVFG